MSRTTSDDNIDRVVGELDQVLAGNPHPSRSQHWFELLCSSNVEDWRQLIARINEYCDARWWEMSGGDWRHFLPPGTEPQFHVVAELVINQQRHVEQVTTARYRLDIDELRSWQSAERFVRLIEQGLIDLAANIGQRVPAALTTVPQVELHRTGFTLELWLWQRRAWLSPLPIASPRRFREECELRMPPHRIVTELLESV